MFAIRMPEEQQFPGEQQFPESTRPRPATVWTPNTYNLHQSLTTTPSRNHWLRRDTWARIFHRDNRDTLRAVILILILVVMITDVVVQGVVGVFRFLLGGTD